LKLIKLLYLTFRSNVLIIWAYLCSIALLGQQYIQLHSSKE